MNKNKSYQFIKYQLLILLCLTGLTSCDNGSSIAQHQQVKDIVNIGRLICGGHLPLAVVEKKYQSDLQSFRLNTIQNHDWNDVITDMKSGKLAGTFILSPLAMNLIHEGLDAKIVLMADRNGNGFVLSNNLKSISELKERQSIIAVPHIYSQHHVLLHMILQQYGIDKEQVKVLGMPPRDMINSLKNGEIDGFVVGEPEGHRAISLNVGWMAAISPDIWTDHMDHVFVASNDFIENHPEQLQELITQLVRAGEFIENNPHEAAIMGEDYTGAQAEVFEKVLTTPENWISYSNMVANETDMTSMAQKLVEMQLWPNVPDNLALHYFDMRFAQQAEQAIRPKY